MKFSVTIPAYKAKFFKECIDSILSQTYTDFEIVIVNDASPEDLDNIVNLYDDQRIRYYKNDVNCGAINVVDNWNKCLEYSTGDFVICMGDDDKLAPKCLEEYAKLIEKYPHIDAFHARVIRIDDNSEIIDILPDQAEIETVYSLMRHRFNRRLQYIGDFCYRTSKLRSLGGYYKLPMAWDSDDITSFMMANPNGVACTNIGTFMYRVNAFTISNTGNNIIKMGAITEADKWLTHFIESLEPRTIEEKLEYKLLPDLKQKSINYEKGVIVYSSFQRSLSNIFFWIRNKSKYSLSNKIILKALMQYLHNKNIR